MMESISILSFLAFFACAAAGAYVHYRKVVKTGRHALGLWAYLTSNNAKNTTKVGVAILAESWVMATTGTADFINIELMWAMMTNGNFHVASVGVAYLAYKSGYGWDSTLSKGSEENGGKA